MERAPLATFTPLPKDGAVNNLTIVFTAVNGRPPASSPPKADGADSMSTRSVHLQASNSQSLEHLLDRNAPLPRGEWSASSSVVENERPKDYHMVYHPTSKPVKGHRASDGVRRSPA